MELIIVCWIHLQIPVEENCHAEVITGFRIACGHCFLSGGIDQRRTIVGRSAG